MERSGSEKFQRGKNELKLLFLERFQPLLKTTEKALVTHLKEDLLIIGILDALEHFTPKNLLTGGERAAMIAHSLTSYPQISPTSYLIIPIPNCELRGLLVDHISGLVPKFDKILTPYSDVQKLFIEKGFKSDLCPFTISSFSKKEWLDVLQNTDLISPAVREYLQSLSIKQRINQVFP
ncbi:MAG: hypothetical protein ACFFDI_17245 [Promethearchaeota archaeon]